ncbi:MAG: alkaline phosphatase family protein [Flavobacteriaceae bacterium]|nr:alkaline phosphatase family protein [Bacteroidia bacterium]MBT8287993.1 alkaline phosphatase family protein [Bacteroidia bacterium]NNF76300.1 alkaline phosphatase family protein [Flavobacteriaceae bacterium]NNK73505.1 alkaline phosphatase family protein [Flavobacteriaceae bacterium]
MNRFLAYLFLAFISWSCAAQGNSEMNVKPEVNLEQFQRPKLVVGIIVDQMRYDYLTRFHSKYGSGGFMRLIDGGFNCKNTHFNYVPTYTGPGHSSVYTGTTPRNHGIISNSWFDKIEKEFVYCAGDDSVISVGTPTAAGKMSPHRMISSTFSDENRLFTQMRGKTIGISIKDRGAVLPAGHTANAAYWYTGKTEGNWITSSYYMDVLPQWVQDFNASDAVEYYLKPWNTLRDIQSYTESGDDLNEFEGGFYGKETAVFPYDLVKLAPQNGNLDILRSTPYGNSLVTDFAIAALKNEKLGTDQYTDILAISYSSTDYIGHNFGVNSKEVQDTYLRLDLEVERLLKYLDKEVGQGNFTVFLTSDHGAVDVPNYLRSVNIPSGYIDGLLVKSKFSEYLESTFRSKEIVENVSNNQVFLNKAELERLKLNKDEVCSAIIDEIISYDHIDKAYSARTIHNGSFTSGIEALLHKGFNQKRSGDILIVNKPAHIQYSQTGSTHGTGLNYDTHVPLLFYGQGIKKGQSLEYVPITSIAPTISALLKMSYPNAATGQPLYFVLD